MRKLGAGIIVVAVSWGSQSAIAQEPTLFDKLDANKDGFVTADEAGGDDKKQIFARLLRTSDKNSDGKLSREEFTAGLAPKPDAPARPADRPPGDRPPGDRPPGDRPPGDRPAGPDAREILSRFDKNGDGKLSKEEMPDRMRENFERIDANKDDFADREELVKALAQFGGRPPGAPGGPPPGFIPGGAVLRALDANNDGQLSAEEIAGASKALAALDKNGDGMLSREEMSPGMRPGGVPGGGNPQALLERLREADTNGDGKLSKDEAPPFVRERFDQLDTNKDGQIEKEELRTLLPRLLDRRPEGGERRPDAEPKKP